MTACPSGVDYQHFIDTARIHVAESYSRPWFDKLIRGLISQILPYPRRFKVMVMLARLSKPFASLFGQRLGAMISRAPGALAKGDILDGFKIFPAIGERRQRVALLSGCAQQVLRPSINEATIRLLNRAGVDVVVGDRTGCCGALDYHLGGEQAALKFAQANIESWLNLRDGDGLNAIVSNAAGCGTLVKDYGHMMRRDADWTDKAEAVSALARDVTELFGDDGLGPLPAENRLNELPSVVYHDACSLMHGQGITKQPRQLLEEAGFQVKEVSGRHYCCGSAGSYNFLQPGLAEPLNQRRIEAIEKAGGEVIATGNIGCLEQLAAETSLPVVHTVELLDWATGGPKPPGL